MEKRMRYRVAWRDRRTGDGGYGIMVESRELVEGWVRAGRRDFPELLHWIEEVPLEEAIGKDVREGERSPQTLH